MNIAILFSGRITNYDTYYKNLQHHIIKNNNVDIYLSHSKELNEDLSDFVKLYQPKIVINEYINHNGPNPPHYNGMCMFYNRYRLFNAFKQHCIDNSLNYDFIIVYRLDILTLSDINFDNIIVNDNTIHVPNIHHSGGINDFLAIGNMGSIEKYCNLYMHYSQLLKISGYTQSNEKILKIYLDGMHINIQLFPFNCILRDTYWQNGGSQIKINQQSLC